MHPRAADLDCYIKTKQTKTFKDASGGCTKKAHGCKGRVAVTIVGELSRLDPNTTIASNVVAPYAHAGYEVVVFVTVQAVRPQAGWHGARFKTMPRYNEEQQLTVVDNFGALFLSHGATAVVTHLYDLVKRPPMMPSSRTGGPGHSNGGKEYTRFQQAWESYPLHCLVHSNVWRDVHRYEQATHQFDYLLKMRGDSHWLHAAPLPDTQHAGSVSIRECMPWDGYNDKFAYLPRAYAKDWMMLFEAYYDQNYHGYTNSEQLQKLIAKTKQIPVVQVRLVQVVRVVRVVRVVNQTGRTRASIISPRCSCMHGIIHTTSPCIDAHLFAAAPDRLRHARLLLLATRQQRPTRLFPEQLCRHHGDGGGARKHVF